MPPAAPASLLSETEAFLHDQIPLTAAMQVRVAAFNAKHLLLTAPLAPNHNHLGTAFGGSLASLATLAGYTLLWLELDDRSAHIVIQESHLRYLAPVRGELRACAPRLAAPDLAAFQRTFQKTGKARLTLPITLQCDGQICVEFTGTFVALR